MHASGLDTEQGLYIERSLLSSPSCSKCDVQQTWYAHRGMLPFCPTLRVLLRCGSESWADVLVASLPAMACWADVAALLVMEVEISNRGGTPGSVELGSAVPWVPSSTIGFRQLPSVNSYEPPKQTIKQSNKQTTHTTLCPCSHVQAMRLAQLFGDGCRQEPKACDGYVSLLCFTYRLVVCDGCYCRLLLLF